MRYAVGVGANRGERAATIAAAETLLGDGIVLESRATLVETAPVGGPSGQDPFLNGAWLVVTDMGPHQLLHRLQRIENVLGRTRTVRWGPRTLDLDLLLREDGLVVATPVLILPHPLLAQRPFVLEPLADIAGGWRHPLLGRTIRELAVGA